MMTRVFFAGALALTACAPAASAPAPDVKPELRPIAAMHASKCGACHVRPEPRTRTREHLEEAFSRHRKRVRLSEDEWARMVDYLAAGNAQQASR